MTGIRAREPQVAFGSAGGSSLIRTIPAVRHRKLTLWPPQNVGDPQPVVNDVVVVSVVLVLFIHSDKNAKEDIISDVENVISI